MTYIESPIVLEVITRIRNFSIRSLVTLSILFILNGWSWIEYQTPSRVASLEFIDLITPDMVGIFWCLTGGIGLIARIIDSRKTYQASFFLLIACSLATSAFYFISWVLYLIPWTDRGFPLSFASAVVYLIIAVSVFFLSKMFTITMGLDTLRIERVS